jgi:hypothetical protein
MFPTRHPEEEPSGSKHEEDIVKIKISVYQRCILLVYIIRLEYSYHHLFRFHGEGLFDALIPTMVVKNNIKIGFLWFFSGCY